MIRIISILLLITIFQGCLAQNKFSEAIEFGTTVTGDFINNFKGGIKQGFTYIGKEELTLGLNTEKAGIWKNGYLFVHGLNTHGQGPSEKLTGDLQILSNLEAGDHTGLFEFWYSHQIGKFSILLGQHDMNTEFLGSKYSSIFVNSSFGIMPSISLNMPISIYPLAAPGFVLKYESGKNFIYKLGVYDGNPGNLEDNRYNLQLNISSQEGLFNIGEIEYILKEGERETVNFKIGSYYHTGIFPNYSDTTNHIKNNFGLYALVDKALFPRNFNAGHGLCIFLQGGLATPTCNMVHYYLGGGLRYHGLLPDRYKDQLGIGIAHISLSKAYLNYVAETLSFETSIETTYIFHFGGKYYIQPCMQYVINPGINKNFSNIFVGILRFSLTY